MSHDRKRYGVVSYSTTFSRMDQEYIFIYDTEGDPNSSESSKMIYHEIKKEPMRGGLGFGNLMTKSESREEFLGCIIGYENYKKATKIAERVHTPGKKHFRDFTNNVFRKWLKRNLVTWPWEITPLPMKQSILDTKTVKTRAQKRNWERGLSEELREAFHEEWESSHIKHGMFQSSYDYWRNYAKWRADRGSHARYGGETSSHFTTPSQRHGSSIASSDSGIGRAYREGRRRRLRGLGSDNGTLSSYSSNPSSISSEGSWSHVASERSRPDYEADADSGYSSRASSVSGSSHSSTPSSASWSHVKSERSHRKRTPHHEPDHHSDMESDHGSVKSKTSSISHSRSYTPHPAESARSKLSASGAAEELFNQYKGKSRSHSPRPRSVASAPSSHQRSAAPSMPDSIPMPHDGVIPEGYYYTPHNNPFGRLIRKGGPLP